MKLTSEMAKRARDDLKSLGLFVPTTGEDRAKFEGLLEFLERLERELPSVAKQQEAAKRRKLKKLGRLRK